MQKLPAGKLTVAIADNVEIWLDGGHNPGAAAMVAKHMADLEEREPRPLVMICGMLDTKDPAGYFNEFSSLAERVFTVPIQSSDAGVPADRLAQLAAESGLSSQTTTSLQEAITLAAQSAPVRILICGSLYLVGDALAQNETPPT
jgi:dihydrofolate synthase/folylpolyglutamate synthase